MVEFFLINKEDSVIRLNKGITEERVIELLGDDYKAEPGMFPGEEKRVYHFKNKITGNANYKLLIRNGLLEWALQVSSEYSYAREYVRK